MDERLKKIVSKASGFWKNLSKKKRAVIISSAAAVLVILIIAVTALHTTKYELLTSGLSEEEAGEVYNAVTEQNVPVKIKGTSIYVKEGTADKLRMELAEQGLPEGNLNYDIYSSGSNFAETDKDKEVKYLHQIQNRLQETIETIPGVKQAIVNIAQSDDDTYVLESDKTPTTASVKLTLAAGTTLSSKQVNGIVQLVKNSVSGLSADNITVADSDGTQLNGNGTGLDDTAEQLQLKSRYESTVKSKIVQMLEKIYGKDNVNVTVNAAIDFSSKSTVTTSYTSGVIAYVSRSSEVTYNGSSLAGGTAGVSGTQPTYPSTSGSGLTAFDSKTNETSSMLVGSVRQEIKAKGGELSKLSVAVILNSRNTQAADTDTEGLREYLANAVGTGVENISVGQMAFSSASVPARSTAAGWSFPSPASGGILLYIIFFGALIIIIGTAVLLIILKKRRRKREREEAEQEALEAAQTQQQEKGPNDKKPVQVKSIEETIEESETNSVKHEIEDFAEKKPELVAQILKNWLKD